MLEESWDVVAVVIYTRKKKGESCDARHGTSVLWEREDTRAEPVVSVSHVGLILSTRAVL